MVLEVRLGGVLGHVRGWPAAKGDVGVLPVVYHLCSGLPHGVKLMIY